MFTTTRMKIFTKIVIFVFASCSLFFYKSSATPTYATTLRQPQQPSPNVSSLIPSPPSQSPSPTGSGASGADSSTTPSPSNSSAPSPAVSTISPTAAPSTAPVTQQPSDTTQTTSVPSQTADPEEGEIDSSSAPIASPTNTTTLISVNPDEPPSADSPTASDDSACFPLDATVELQNGRIKMADLKVGDRVKVAESEFSKVFMFTHRVSNVNTDFVKISFSESAKSIRLTSGHYLHVNEQLVAARTVVMGDELNVDGKIMKVSNVETVKGKGLFNPQTLQGDIVVDGVRASTYTTAVEPGLAHRLLSPLRALYNFGGFSTSIFDAGNFGLERFLPKGSAIVG